MNKLILTILLSFLFHASYAQDISIIETVEETTKKIRNAIKDGNEAYLSGRLMDAYNKYEQAINEDPSSNIAKYNKAVTLVKVAQIENDNKKKSEYEQKALNIFDELSKCAENSLIASRSFYNLGNFAFEGKKLDESIFCYKNALRKNPNDDKARLNLRYVQKLKEQNKNNQNKQQKEDKKEKDQNSEKNKQQQNQNKKNEQNQNKKNKQDKQQNIDSKKAEQILKSMENEEQATRRKVEARKNKENINANRGTIEKPW